VRFYTHAWLSRHHRTVRSLLVFIAACSGNPAVVPTSLPTSRPPIPAPPGPDAAPPAPVLAHRGDACGQRTCDAGLTCGEMSGGYCLSACGAGAACDGACVATPTRGELCLARCGGDTECRTDEGYVCDRQWHACILPNTAAIVPETCAGSDVRDAAFADGEAWTNAEAQHAPSSVVIEDGTLVTLAASVAGAVSIVKPAPAVLADHGAAPMLVRAGGKLHAVWVSGDGVVFATSSDRGSTWSSPVRADDHECSEAGCFGRPRIVAAGALLHVIYPVRGAGLRVRTSRDGGATFGPSTTAGRGFDGNAVAGADGRLHIVALDGDPHGAYGSAQQAIEYTVATTTGFAPPVTVSARDELLPFFFGNPSIAVDDRRHWIYIAYVRGGRDARWDIVIAASKDAGKTWSRTTLGEPCTLDMVPNLALDSRTGTVHVAWYASLGTGAFMHATCAAGATTCRTWGRINSEPFATLTTGRLDARWVGDAESLVIDDTRRILHAVWTQPTADGAARIFHASAKLR
jgi:hypothetical protein